MRPLSKSILINTILSLAFILALSSCDKSLNGEVKTHIKAVDLGLSVKWASMDLGAASSLDNGDMYSWGEMETKGAYSESNYSYKMTAHYVYNKYGLGEDIITGEIAADAFLGEEECTEEVYSCYWTKKIYKPSSLFDRYELKSSDFEPDNLTALLSGNDIATKTLGKGWRIPTWEEVNELTSKCKIEYTTDCCFKVTGPNGNSISFPFGKVAEDENCATKSTACIWTSTLDQDDPTKAFRACFSHMLKKKESVDRYIGICIRPVYKEEK